LTFWFQLTVHTLKQKLKQLHHPQILIFLKFSSANLQAKTSRVSKLLDVEAVTFFEQKVYLFLLIFCLEGFATDEN